MQTYDTISLVPELAATILGFSGVVVAFQREALQTFGRRLLTLVVNAVAALVFSLAALAVISPEESAGVAKIVCETSFASYLVGHLVFLAREFVLGFQRREAQDANPYLVAPFLLVNLIMAVIVLSEVVADHNSWVAYTWSLIFLVSLSAYLFARMIWLTWHELNARNN